MKKKKRNRLILFLALLAALAAVFLLIAKKGNILEINKGGAPEGSETVSSSPRPVSPISGLACENADRRPLAVMLSGDAVTRPLSGLVEADLVLNMPVITGSITRLMAVYVCNEPKEIGSIRSARDDYIPLAKSFDAIYAHWGGSHFALDLLNKGVMDNLDALISSSSVFYRKSGIAAPHNGFSSFSRLYAAAEKKGYRLQGKEIGYPHFEVGTEPKGDQAKTLSIGFPGEFKVEYQYDPASNSYWRFRGGKKEMDRNTNSQVAAKNVVIMRAVSRQIEGQYNTVQVEGEGRAAVYRGGEEIIGAWKKAATSDQASKLFFYDGNGQEIKFVPGQIWIEVVQPDQSVTWQAASN